jgi:hypothetical protein
VTDERVEEIVAYERAHANRRTVTSAAEQRLAGS